MLSKTCTVRTKARKEPECMICNLSFHALINLVFNKLEKETNTYFLYLQTGNTCIRAPPTAAGGPQWTDRVNPEQCVTKESRFGKFQAFLNQVWFIAFNKLTDRQTDTHARAYTPLLTQSRSIWEVPWEKQKERRVPPSALLIFSSAIYSRFVLIPKKINQRAQLKKIIILWKLSLNFMQMICFNSISDTSMLKPVCSYALLKLAMLWG